MRKKKEEFLKNAEAFLNTPTFEELKRQKREATQSRDSNKERLYPEPAPEVKKIPIKKNKRKKITLADDDTPKPRYNYLKGDPRNGYEHSPKFLAVNDQDPDLEPIFIPLPEQPKWEDIEGFGTPAKDQVFQYTKIPYKITALERKFSRVEDIYAELKAHRKYYIQEIKFISREQKRCREGFWFFNNGVPTFIDGWHYRFLNYWRHGSKRFDYRSRDRKFFLFARFCFEDLSCYGFNYVKFRQEGATSKTSCINYAIATEYRHAHCGIQSKDEVSAEAVFINHVVNSWRQMPFYLRPTYDGTSNPKTELNFTTPALKQSKKADLLAQDSSLQSWIDFGSSTEGFYDGQRLVFHHGDEAGKSIEADIGERHMILKPAGQRNGRVTCLYINTSTVGEMTKGGGTAFFRLCEQSHYHKKTKNGQTLSGLYNLFIPSYDGYANIDPVTKKPFIDKYGNSDIEATRRYFENQRQALLEAEKFDELSELIRQFPFTYKEAFRASSKTCHFNVYKLETRISDFKLGNKNKIRGNFVWKDGIRDGDVEWQPTEAGRWWVSKVLHPSEANRREIVAGTVCPGNRHRFIAGGDPFKFNQVQYGKKSDGAGAVFMKYDPSIDNANSPRKEWKTERFICTYSNRPPTVEEYVDDMIKMCVYYGCEMNPEINVDALWTQFDQRGYNGYLYYRTDPKTGKLMLTPGATTNDKTQSEIYNCYTTHIDNNCDREVHEEILLQALEIDEEMTEYDLFVAAGYALMGARRQELDASLLPTQDVSSYFKKRKYKVN